jgi:hypothetical protein
MLQIAPGVRVYLACRPVDLRKGFDGLSAEVAQVLKADPFSGGVFIFRGVGAGIEFRLCFSLSRLFYLTRTETGMPRLVMRLRTLQPIFASVF